MNDYNKEDIWGIIFFAISLIFLIFTSYMAFTKAFLWVDETFTVNIVKLSFNNLIGLTSIDVHPPFYYLIYKLFIKIGSFISFSDVIIIGKFVSLLPFYLLFAISLFKVRKNFGWLTAGLFTLTLIAMPQMMNFAYELRMYGWGLFFITCSFILVYDLIKNNFNYLKWILLTLFTIASLYTHYYVAIAAALIYLYILYYLIKNNKEDLKTFFASVIIVVVSYFPWIPIIFRQIASKTPNYWIDSITVSRIVGYVFYVFSPDCPFIYGNEIIGISILGIILLISCIILLVRNKKDDNSRYAFLGVGLCFAIPIVGIIISLILRPFYHPRYIIPVLGIFWLGISILLAQNFNKKQIFIPIIIIILVCSVIGALTFYDNVCYRQDIDTNISNSLQVIGDGSIIICCQNNLERHFSNYFLVNNTYFICDYSDNESYDEFIVQVDSIINDPQINQQINGGKQVYIVNLFKTNNTIPLVHENYTLSKIPIRMADSNMFNYTNLEIYKINFNN